MFIECGLPTLLALVFDQGKWDPGGGFLCEHQQGVSLRNGSILWARGALSGHMWREAGGEASKGTSIVECHGVCGLVD